MLNIWTWTATDCVGNTTSRSTTISFNGDPQPFAGEQFATCAGDFNQDHHINTVDLLMILSEFGCDHNNCGCDLTMDEKTNTPDLLTFLSAFGGECE